MTVCANRALPLTACVVLLGVGCGGSKPLVPTTRHDVRTIQWSRSRVITFLDGWCDPNIRRSWDCEIGSVRGVRSKHSAEVRSPHPVENTWQTYLRRFDLEHTFRLFKQTLGWTRPKLRQPQAADRWTWIIIVAYTQLRLARPLAADLRRPWEKPLPANRLTPTRVRRGFRNIRRITTHPASAPKPSRPGPGRPPGVKNHQPAPRHDVGKTVKRPKTLTARDQQTG